MKKVGLSEILFAVAIFLIMFGIPIWYHFSVIYKTSFVGKINLHLPEETISYTGKSIKVSVYSSTPGEQAIQNTGVIKTDKGVWNISGYTYFSTRPRGTERLVGTVEIPYSKEIEVVMSPLDLEYNIYIRK